MPCSLRRFGCERRVGDKTIMQGFAPIELEIALRGKLLPPVLANRFVSREVRVVEHRLHNFMRRVAAVKRINHRLHNGNRAVVGTGVRPAFEVVRAVDMPVRELRSLVHMRAEVNDGLDLA